jgi:outer membrane receptor for ferrienterochelin and colicin
VTVLPGSDPYFKVDDIFYPAFKVAEYFHWDDFKLNTVFERNFYTPVEVWWLGQGVYHAMLAINPEYKWDLSPTDSLTMDASLMLQDNDQIWLQNGYLNSGLQTTLNNNSGAFTGQYYNVHKGDIITNLDPGNNSSESYIGDKLVYRTDRIANNQIAAGVEVGRRAFYGNGFAFFWDNFASTDGISMPHDLYAWLEYSAFVEDVVNLTDKLTMTVGGREDGVSYPDPYTSYYNNIKASLKNPSIAHFSPAIDFAYQVSPVTTLKTSYTQGFRFPNAADVIRNLSPRANPGTSTLETYPVPAPETMDSFEFDVHHDVPALKMGWDVNTYYNMLHKTLGWAQPGSSALGAEYNSPDFDSIGFELVDRWQILPNTTLDASYSFSRPLNYDKALVIGAYSSIDPTNAEGTQWARYPDQMVKLGTTSTFFTKWTFHWDMQYRAGVKYDPYGTTDANYAAYYAWLDHASIVFNAAVKYDINPNWWVKFSVKNLTHDRNTQPVWGLNNQFYATGYSAATLTYVEIGCKF